MKNIRNQSWNAKDLQERFFLKQEQIERDLAVTRKYKIPSNDNYKVIYDEQLGEFQVFARLSAAAAVKGRSSLLAELRELRAHGPHPYGGAFDESRVVIGYNRAIDRLITEFSDLKDDA